MWHKGNKLSICYKKTMLKFCDLNSSRHVNTLLAACECPVFSGELMRGMNACPSVGFFCFVHVLSGSLIF